MLTVDAIADESMFIRFQTQDFSITSEIKEKSISSRECACARVFREHAVLLLLSVGYGILDSLLSPL